MSPSLEPAPPAAGPIVQRLTAAGFSIDGTAYAAVLLTPERAFAWSPSALADLAPDDFEPLLAFAPQLEFILLGTGPTMRFAQAGLIDGLAARGFAVEAMDSRAAARTWGVLRGEGRWIGAALMPL